MTAVLLDTSAYSAHLRYHPAVKLALQECEQVVLSPVVIGELRAGFLKGKHRRANEDALDLFLAKPRVRVVPIVEATAERYSIITDELRRAGKPLPANDVWIAASAMEHGLKVLTLDRHFLAIKQILVDYVGEAEGG